MGAKKEEEGRDSFQYVYGARADSLTRLVYEIERIEKEFRLATSRWGWKWGSIITRARQPWPYKVRIWPVRWATHHSSSKVDSEKPIAERELSIPTKSKL